MNKLNTNKIIIFSLMFLFVISLTSSISIGTFKQNENIQLYQTCNNCTFCNWTAVKYPNSTNILVNVETNKDGTFFNSTLLGGNTSETIGTYSYCYNCGNAAESLTGCIDFDISKTGVKLTEASSRIYTSLVIVVIFIFLFCLWAAIVLPFSNKRNELGRIYGIERLKYVKMFFMFLCYPLFIWLINLMLTLSDNFSSLTQYTGFFEMLFLLLMAFAYPIYFLMMATFVVVGWKDLQLTKLLSRGMTIK